MWLLLSHWTGEALQGQTDIETDPVISVKQTVHDTPHDDNPMPVSWFPLHLTVLCGEDIVGQSASIEYAPSLM